MLCFLFVVAAFILGYWIGKKSDSDSGNATGFDVTVDKPVQK